MDALKKYLGVIIILVAVFILVIPACCGNTISSNGFLIFVLVLMVVGLLVHIFANRFCKK